MCKIPNLKNIVESLSPKLEQYTKLLPDILNAFNLEVYIYITFYYLFIENRNVQLMHMMVDL